MELPILGTEPLPVEFANTRHGDFDCLGTPELVARWFAEMSLPAPEAGPARALRDAVHRLLTAASEDEPLDPDAVAVVNAATVAAPTSLRLDGCGRQWRARWVDTTTGTTAVLGRIATCAVELLTGSALLLRCPAPDCGLFFVKDHARRRFCHPSCGHRDRQARYYRRRNPR